MGRQHLAVAAVPSLGLVLQLLEAFRPLVRARRSSPEPAHHNFSDSGLLVLGQMFALAPGPRRSQAYGLPERAPRSSAARAPPVSDRFAVRARAAKSSLAPGHVDSSGYAPQVQAPRSARAPERQRYRAFERTAPVPKFSRVSAHCVSSDSAPQGQVPSSTTSMGLALPNYEDFGPQAQTVIIPPTTHRPRSRLGLEK